MSEHFSNREFFCPCSEPSCSGKRAPHPGLVLRLEVMRQVYRRPITVNSGVRCPAHNEREGGKSSSAHLTGEAADLHCATSRDRMAMARAAGLAGFRRIGIAKTFIHVDVSRSLDQDVLWLYS